MRGVSNKHCLLTFFILPGKKIRVYIYLELICFPCYIYICMYIYDVQVSNMGKRYFGQCMSFFLLHMLTYPVNLEVLIEPWHEISYNVVCATNKGSDQPAHMRSLIRAFASRLNTL